MNKDNKCIESVKVIHQTVYWVSKAKRKVFNEPLNNSDIPYFRGLAPRGAYRFSKFLVGR